MVCLIVGWLVTYVNRYLFLRMIYQLRQELFTSWCTTVDPADSPFFNQPNAPVSQPLLWIMIIDQCNSASHAIIQRSNCHMTKRSQTSMFLHNNQSNKTLQCSPSCQTFSLVLSLCRMSQPSYSRVGSDRLWKILIRELIFNLNIRLFRDVQSVGFTTWQFLCGLQTEFWLILIIEDLTPPLTKLPFEDFKTLLL